MSTSNAKKKAVRQRVERLTGKMTDALKIARECAEWTQEDAGKALGVERKTVWYWESGNAIMPLVYCALLAGESPRAHVVLCDAIGMLGAGPPPGVPVDDIELRAMLGEASRVANWPGVRRAIIAVLDAHRPAA